jgi:hypothetical protein
MKNDVSASDFLLSGEGSGFDSQLLHFLDLLIEAYMLVGALHVYESSQACSFLSTDHRVDTRCRCVGVSRIFAT